MNIQFTGNGASFTSGQFDKKEIHSSGADACDFTLCGLTLDGDPDTLGDHKEVDKRIACKQCLEIIRFCKAIKL